MTDSVERLYEAIIAARTADPARSRTARLLQAGRSKMAKKLAEEAVEVVIDAMNGERGAVVRESADLIYHLAVLWTASGVKPADVWAEMERRERLLGIAEKLPKNMPSKNLASKNLPSKNLPPKSLASKNLPEAGSRRKVVALESRRIRKRR